MQSVELAERVAKLAWDKKGHDISIIDLRNISDVSDFFVLVTGDSEIQIRAIYDYIEKQLLEDDVRPWHKEGYQKLSWVILDFVDVVVHIFKPNSRNFYNLERLWGDAPITRLEEDVPDRILLEREG